VKTALEADDVDEIGRTAEALATVSQKMGQAMYANAESSEAGAGAPGEAGDADATGDEDVVDAEIVDEAPGSDGSAA
jgi:molecular chaperone DnaK